MKKIVIKFNGGFGNQIFQYCFGEYLSKKLGVEVVYHSVNDVNDLLLLTSNKIHLAKRIDILNSGLTGVNFIDRWLKRLYKRQSLLKKYYYEFHSNSQCVEDFINSSSGTIYLDGYWQNIIYTEFADDLLNKFDPIIFLGNHSEALVSEIKSINSVVIHVRLGDYINNDLFSSIYNHLNLDYYTLSLSRFNGIEKIFVISNDIDLAKSTFPAKINNATLEFVKSSNAIEDFCLMSIAKNNVIANSTFSWWASYLTRKQKLKVIAPARWYINDDKNSSVRIHVDSWELI